MTKWKECIGKKYNGLLALRRASKEETPWKSNETPIWVKCDNCGDEWSARLGDLLKLKTNCPKCCGKTGGRGRVDRNKIGMKFGKLTIIDKAPPHRSKGGNYKTYWVCKCDCGNIVNVCQRNLFGRIKNGTMSRTISCGCSTKSSGQLKLEKILTEANINFESEYKIEDFSNYSRFDIGIKDENNKLIGLIEYDGEQHFRPVEIFGGEEKYKIQIERDERKNKYCKEHNIPLLRIPYTDYEKLDINYIFRNLGLK